MPAATGVQRHEATFRMVGDDVGQRGLAGAGRPVEDQRAEPVGVEHAPQQLAGAEEMLLADELVHVPRPHPRRQRLCLAAVGFVDVAEEVDGGDSCTRLDRPVVDHESGDAGEVGSVSRD